MFVCLFDVDWLLHWYIVWIIPRPTATLLRRVRHIRTSETKKHILLKSRKWVFVCVCVCLPFFPFIFVFPISNIEKKSKKRKEKHSMSMVLVILRSPMQHKMNKLERQQQQQRKREENISHFMYFDCWDYWRRNKCVCVCVCVPTVCRHTDSTRSLVLVDSTCRRWGGFRRFADTCDVRVYRIIYYYYSCSNGWIVVLVNVRHRRRLRIVCGFIKSARSTIIPYLPPTRNRMTICKIVESIQFLLILSYFFSLSWHANRSYVLFMLPFRIQTIKPNLEGEIQKQKMYWRSEYTMRIEWWRRLPFPVKRAKLSKFAVSVSILCALCVRAYMSIRAIFCELSKPRNLNKMFRCLHINSRNDFVAGRGNEKCDERKHPYASSLLPDLVHAFHHQRSSPFPFDCELNNG